MFTPAARPEKTTGLTATSETLLGQNNGAFSAIANTLEYRFGDGTWTSGDGTDLSGLAGGTTIQVRGKAATTAPRSDIVSYSIQSETPITVRSDTGTQSATGLPAEQTGHPYGEWLTEPASPIPQDANYTFTSWYKDPVYSNLWNFSSETLTTAAITLYVGWRQVRFPVSVTVMDGDHPYDGAVLALKRGSETIVTGTTDASSEHRFTQSVESRLYNIVVICPDPDGCTMTALVNVVGDTATTITLTLTCVCC